MFEDVSTLAKHRKEVHMVGCMLQDKCDACGEVGLNNNLLLHIIKIR